MSELIFSSWDIKPFMDDIWREASLEVRDLIRNRWEENALSSKGVHLRQSPEWVEIDPNGCPLPPFTWNEERRAILKAELDAYYARMYGLSRKQLRYILDPADLTPRELEDITNPYEEIKNPLEPQGYATRCQASTFPGETFRVLKDKETRQYGEYRTRRLVLEAWNRLEGVEIGKTPEYEQHSTQAKPPLPAIAAPLEKSKSKLQPEQKNIPQPVANAPAEAEPAPQSSFSDFGLYKCETCEKLVMGFDRDNHVSEAHRGKNVAWKKIR